MHSKLVAGFGLLVLSLSVTSAHAGERFFRFDPTPPPPMKRYEPPAPPSPPLTDLDRNMMPAANAKSAGDYDLSERITFGDPQPKKKR